jgi:glycosyltransferase involved in cell wall biosynthesis
MLVYAFYESDTRVLQYTRALVERGDAVDVIALRREGTPNFEVLEGVNVYRIQTRKPNERGRLSYLLRLLRFFMLSTFVLAKKHFHRRYDVIHVHNVPDFLVFAATVPKLLGARVILDIHDILPEFYASKFNVHRNSTLVWLLLLVEKLSLKFSNHVIVANHLWYERLVARSVRREKCMVIINYPDPEVFFPRQKDRTDGRFLIMYPGTLNAHQGLDIAIRAFARVAPEMPDADFHIYGEGPTKPALMQLASGLQLSERVIFHEFLPTREIAYLMSQSDLAVVPKRASSEFGNEAASTKILEFMSLGVPLIVSRTKVDAFYHNDSMLKFFESENEADLASATLSLYQDRGLRSRLVASGFQYVRQHNWNERRSEYLTLVDTLASRRAPLNSSSAAAGVPRPSSPEL